MGAVFALRPARSGAVASRPAQRTLTLPLDFDVGDLLAHCRDVFVPAMLADARRHAGAAADEQRRREHAAGRGAAFSSRSGVGQARGAADVHRER